MAAVIQLTMPVLTVLLPVWVLSYTSGQRWVPSAALALNTAIVVGAQTPWATRVVTPVSAARSAHLAAGTLLVSCILMGVAAVNLGPTYAAVVVVVAVVFLTIGEVTGGAATWFVALQDVPPAMEGQYQSAFSMSSSAARIVGSAVALPLMTGVVVGGWIILGAAMAAAALAVSALATPRGEVTSGDLMTRSSDVRLGTLTSTPPRLGSRPSARAGPAGFWRPWNR